MACITISFWTLRTNGELLNKQKWCKVDNTNKNIKEIEEKKRDRIKKAYIDRAWLRNPILNFSF